MKYNFRKCSLDDFDFLFELKKQNFKFYVEKIWGWDDEEQRERLKRDLEEHLEHKRIIELDGKKIGVYATHLTEIGEFFINEISLLKEYQKQGIGTDILTKQLEENKKNGIKTRLQVFKENPAKKLYERLGFTVYNETETHYQMEKDIDSKENKNYYSYVMGISREILILKEYDFEIEKEFDIEENRNNYRIIFPVDKFELYEEFIVKNLEKGYWNEYLNNEKVVFIFKFEDGSAKKYVLTDKNHDEILELCCKFAEFEFKSIKEMLLSNDFYKEINNLEHVFLFK